MFFSVNDENGEDLENTEKSLEISLLQLREKLQKIWDKLKSTDFEGAASLWRATYQEFGKQFIPLYYQGNFVFTQHSLRVV